MEWCERHICYGGIKNNIGSSKENLNKYPERESNPFQLIKNFQICCCSCISVSVQDEGFLKSLIYMVSENTSDERKNTLDECINRRRNSAEYILDFCITPRSILEISELLGYKEKNR